MTVQYITSTVSTTSTITAPTNIMRGDLLVLLQYAKNSTAALPTNTAVVTFTNSVGTATGSSDTRIVARYKIADGSECGATITGMNGTATNSKHLLVFRSTQGPITVPAVSAYNATVVDTNPGAQTISASGQTTPLIAIGTYHNSSAAVDPRVFTVGGVESADGEISNTTSHYVKYKIYNSSPSDISVDMDDEGTENALSGFYIRVTEGTWKTGIEFISATFEEAATTDADTAVPTSMQKGDVIVCLEYAATTALTNPSDTTPTGFTKIGTAAGTGGTNGSRITASYKVADGTETAVGSLSGTKFTYRAILVYRHFGGYVSKVTAASHNAGISTIANSNQTVTVGSGKPTLVAVAVVGGDGTANSEVTLTSSDATLPWTYGTTATAPKFVAAYNTQQSNESVSNLTASQGGDNGTYNALQSFYLEMRSLPPPQLTIFT